MHVYESVNLLISLFILLITLFVMGALHRAENKRKHMKARETLSLHCDLDSHRRLEKRISHQESSFFWN